jgi:4-amino-4-deoxy-L-arabinose transferase-like glycosyltransferase
VKIVQAVLGAAAVWMIGAAAGGPGSRSRLIAMSIAAVYPPLVWIPAYVLSETLYSLLALATAAALQRTIDRRGEDSQRPARAIVPGLLCGVSILVRPAMLFFLPLAGWWLIARRANRQLLWFVIGTIFVVAPWTVRNIMKYDRFVLVASEGGVTFWTGNHPLSRGEGDLAANPDLKRAELAFRQSHPGLTSEELEPLYYRDTVRHITADPIWWLKLLGRKVFFTVVPAGPSYAVHSRRYRWTSVLSYLLLLPFGVAGLIVLWRSHERPSALLLLAVSALLVCIIFFPQERFRIPVIDPALIVCAAALVRRPPSA